MSLYRIFQSTIARLKRRSWGTTVQQPDGTTVDTGVREFAEELYRSLESDSPIELTGPIKLTRKYAGPAFQISGTDAGISYVAADGSTTGSNPASIRVRIVTVGDNTLLVQSENGGESFLIAKPYELRRSSTDKKTIGSVTYEFTGPQSRMASGTLETIQPAYATGDEIVAVLVANGYQVLGPDGTPLLYADANAGGKRWKPEDSPSNPADNTRWRIFPTNRYTAAVPTIAVTGCTNSSPIEMTVVNHGMRTGYHAVIQGVEGNTAANGTWEIDSKTNRITNATNATPIVITTAARHGYATGDKVHVEGVRGNTAANATNDVPSWTVTVINTFTFSLDTSVGNADFDSDCNARCWLADKFTLYEFVPRTKAVTGATNATPIVLTVTGHGYADNSYVIVLGVEGNTAANNSSATDVWQINVLTANTFELVGSVGNGTYTAATGTVTPAFENFLEPVAGNGTWTSGTGEMLVPARLDIAAQTLAEANSDGLQLGYGLRMRSAEGGTTYGIITALPGTTGFPYEGRPPNMPLNSAGLLSYAGAQLLGDLTELAISDTSLVVSLTMNANHFPHFGAETQLPISQLIQGSPAALVEKWRGFGGGTILGRYGRSYAHWYGSKAFLVTWAAVQQHAANTERNPKGLFSGGTVTIIPDRQRPYNSVGIHTDGSAKFGSLVTKSSGFDPGHAVTGLKGWTFRRMDAGGTVIQETSTVIDGGTGTDLQTAITSSTDATPIVVTIQDHGLSDGMKITIASHATNVAANGVRYVDKLSTDTFALYSDSTLTTPVAGSGAGAGTGGYFTNGLSSSQCVLESLTMEAAAGTKHEIEDLAEGPMVNVDVGGQLTSRASQYRGVRCSPVASQLIYNPPCELNIESYDVIFNSRIEVGCFSLGNRPGARQDAAEDDSAAQYLTCFLVFVAE